MTNEVARLRAGELQPAQPANAALPTVVGSITAALQLAVGSMKADDISIELIADQNGPRSHARFSLRAYCKGRQVEDRDGDV